MQIEGLQNGGHYAALLEQAKKRLPVGTDETTVKRVTWLYIQYGCNNYTDTIGYPFREEDVQDAVSLSKKEGMAFAQWLQALGIVKKDSFDRCYFPEKWLDADGPA